MRTAPLKFDLNILLIIALIAWIALRDSCNTTEPIPVQRDTVIVNYTPPPVVVSVPPGKPQIIIREVPAIVDTSQIIQAYFSSVHYQDTVRTDSVEVVLSEVVARNAIQSRTVGFRYLMPPCSTITITEKITLPVKRKFFIGANIAFSDRFTIIPSIGYQPRTGHLFTAGYNGNTYSIGYLHKVRLK